MRIVLLFVFIISRPVFSYSASLDSLIADDRASVLVIPYMPAMHLSDADVDIADGSQMEISEMRLALRTGLINALNKNFAEVYDTRQVSTDFVRGDNSDMTALYHSLMFESDSVYTLKDAKRFGIKDTMPKKKGSSRTEPETKYINVGVRDGMLIPDYSEKYNTDYLIFLNEIDIKTHADDCINLALKIYRRDLLVHYSIFDKKGKQVYGDVAVSHFASNSNDVNEIMRDNFPKISNYILESLNKVRK